jgi:queuine tRNA-ribosyltransferase
MGSNASQRSPDEMLNFSLLNSATASTLAPRLGKLTLAGRNPILTPHYIPLTSRGAVPHIAHDVMREQTAISGLYFGLEDCMYLAIPSAYRYLKLKVHKALTANAHRGPDQS